MKKINITLFAAFFIAVFLLLLLAYPETISQLEATDYFVWTDDYLKMKMAEMPALTALLSDFILQFFRWQGVGALIESALLLAIGVIMVKLSKHLVKSSYPALGLVLPIALLVIAPFQLEVYLQVFFMLLMVYGFFLFKPQQFWPRMAYTILVACLGLLFTTWTLMCIGIVLIVAGMILRKEKPLTIIYIAIPMLILSTVVVYILNAYVGFIPFERRWLYCPVVDLNVWIYVAVIVVSLAILFIPQGEGWHKVLKWLPSALVGILLIAMVVFMLFSEKIYREEQGYRLASLADQGKWKEILEEIPHDECGKNRAYLCYALLAENGLGTLPDHIFEYPAIFSNSLLYQDLSNAFCRNFNRQFYDKLGIYDECFRQSYEFGIACRNGASFASMRNMVKYALLVDNFPVAEKYIDKLSRSITHKAWAKQWRQALEIQKKRSGQNADKKPLRANTFCGAYSLGLEMLAQLENSNVDKSIVDYALIADLLDCNLNDFLNILKHYSFYNDTQLPKAFAEAVAMIIYDTQDKSLRDLVSYDESYDEKFRQFDMQYSLQMQGKQIDKSQLIDFNGTYWNYYVKVSRLHKVQK